MPTIEFDQECPECKGTGLYVGMAERDGFAVVCHRCKGTAKIHFVYQYNEFTGRKSRKGVLRVLQYNPGMIVGTNGANGATFPIDHFGGISIDAFDRGEGFPIGSEMRQHSCPRWWWQTTGGDSKTEPDSTEYGCGWGMFSSCRKFENKSQCWAKWDAQRSK